MQVEVGGKGNKIGSRQCFFFGHWNYYKIASVINIRIPQSDVGQKPPLLMEKWKDVVWGILKFKENVLLRMNKLT